MHALVVGALGASGTRTITDTGRIENPKRRQETSQETVYFGRDSILQRRLEGPLKLSDTHYTLFSLTVFALCLIVVSLSVSHLALPEGQRSAMVTTCGMPCHH